MEEIKGEQTEADLDYVIADLLSFAVIKSMSEKLKQKYDHLDVLINNAGAVFSVDRILTEDGEERTFQLNVFAPFLLSHLLLPLLQNSKSGRIVFESSAAHSVARKPNFDDMKCEKEYGSQGNYCLSKLYLNWMVGRFCKYLQEKNISNVTANITHPGIVMSQFGQNVNKGFIVNTIYKLGAWFATNADDGCKSEVYLVVSDELEGVTGKYYSEKWKESQPSNRWYSEENEQKLWDYCLSVYEKYM